MDRLPARVPAGPPTELGKQRAHAELGLGLVVEDLDLAVLQAGGDVEGQALVDGGVGRLVGAHTDQEPVADVGEDHGQDQDRHGGPGQREQTDDEHERQRNSEDDMTCPDR